MSRLMNRSVFSAAVWGVLLQAALWAQTYSDAEIAERQTRPYPESRLVRDWIYQDAGTLKVDGIFADAAANEKEKAMIQKGLGELTEFGVDLSAFQKKFDELAGANKPGNDPEWRALYLSVCRARRVERLKIFDDFPRDYLFAKHFVFGDAQAMFAMTDHLTDAIFREKGRDYRTGSQLCRLTIQPDGNVQETVLLDAPAGIIRDPSVSFDGKTVAFSMRRGDTDGAAADDFHLYTMNAASGEVRQITFGPGTADMEPEWLPDGNLVFTSTRSVFSAPCWWSSVCNLYTCDAFGRYIRRLGVDHGHTVFPHMTDDGRITYTRWEYSDRQAGYLHSLFVMNADGTNQTEYYGNNSQFPAAILHARSVPGSTKVVAISGAHHIDQRGKLIMIDRKEGTQAGVGVSLLAPVRPMAVAEGVGTDGSNVVHGTDGEQFQYPFPLDEENFLVCFLPEGGAVRGLKGIKDGKPGAPSFGIYWMDADGRRELLLYDPVISSEQPVAFAPRELPPLRASVVDESKTTGTFYVQDVHFGAGMEGVAPGTVKKMRIVALDYRAKGTVALGLHPWGGHQTSPCAINNGSYDVKHVLGTVDVEEDGSCSFECPSRTPVYFQLLDERGRMVQNMRSWTMVLPGETFSCIGCHEDKNSTFTGDIPATAASRKEPQKIKPFFEPGDEPVREMDRFLTESQKKALDYLGVNAPQGEDVPTGFSYARDVQPIWDAHCIECHAGEKNPAKKDVPLSLLGDERPVSNDEIYNRAKWRLAKRPYGFGKTQGTPGRKFSESYINLTDFGYNAKIPKSVHADIAQAAADPAYLSYFDGDPKKVPNPNRDGYSSDEYAGNGLINWLHVASLCAMLPPYSYGSCSSRLLDYLEPSHYNVQLTEKEKDAVACWIDLCVPYAGSWMERNDWRRLNHATHSGLTPWYVYRDKMAEIYLYFEAKRLAYAELEIDGIAKYLRHQKTGESFSPSAFGRFDFSGRMSAEFAGEGEGIAAAAQRRFVESLDRLPETVPIFGIAEGRDCRGGSQVAGNPIRNLAVNPDAFTYHLRSYPRVTANSHYRYRPEFSPVHLIDGRRDGGESWRPERRTDLRATIEFGREVEIEKVILTLSPSEGQTKTWTSAELEFSDGTTVPMTLQCTAEPQEFSFPAKKSTAISLVRLKEEFPLGDNRIAEWEVFGRDVE